MLPDTDYFSDSILIPHLQLVKYSVIQKDGLTS
jgi:hypothetical protein